MFTTRITMNLGTFAKCHANADIRDLATLCVQLARALEDAEMEISKLKDDVKALESLTRFLHDE